MNFTEFIEINPTIRFGKPCVKGTRIAVYDILGWLASGMSHEKITEDFPEISNTHILACLAFAADREHKFRIAS
jgi:uncharacterized protein (DUF433 family)